MATLELEKAKLQMETMERDQREHHLRHKADALKVQVSDLMRQLDSMKIEMHRLDTDARVAEYQTAKTASLQGQLMTNSTSRMICTGSAKRQPRRTTN